MSSKKTKNQVPLSIEEMLVSAEEVHYPINENTFRYNLRTPEGKIVIEDEQLRKIYANYLEYRKQFNPDESDFEVKVTATLPGKNSKKNNKKKNKENLEPVSGSKMLVFENVDFSSTSETNIHLGNCRFLNCNFHKWESRHVERSFDSCEFINCTLSLAGYYSKCYFQDMTIYDYNNGNDVIVDDVKRFIICHFDRVKFEHLENSVFENCRVLENCTGYYSICPEEGGFVAFKGLRTAKGSPALAKLYIPEDAERRGAGRKCRASKAEVLEIINLKTGKNIMEAKSPTNSIKLTYRVGETVECDKWDEHRWRECSGGIHFFMTKEEAACWVLFGN